MAVASKIPKRRRPKNLAPRASTLRDVAVAVGVSTASASRALTRPHLVSEGLKDQIERAARELGYVPNAAAQSLAGHPRRLIGVVLGSMEDPVATAIVDAMAQALALLDFALLIATVAESQAETTNRVRELVGRGAEAILFASGAVPLRRVAGTQASRILWGALDADDPDQSICCASGYDRARAFALAMRYLANLGHQRIALLARDADQHAAATRAAMGDTDILISHVAYPKNGEPRIADWLSSVRGLPTAPTALVCGSDLVAAAVVNACRRHAIAVPEDLTIVGFGDSELARNTRPTLTTMRVPTREAGIAAATYVAAVLEGLPAPVTKLAVKLIARESSGPFLA